MSVLPPEPGAMIPGVPGDEVGGYVTLDTGQLITGPKTFTADGSSSGSHYYGSVTVNDITILPNPAISDSASMFLDNNTGQVWELFCDDGNEWGVYDKTNASKRLALTNAGELASQNNTLDSGTNGDMYIAGNVNVTGNIATNVTTQTSGYFVDQHDGLVLSDGGSPMILPSAGGQTGRIFTVKNIGTSAVTVSTSSSQTIDGGASCVLSSQYKYVTVQSDGSNWLIVANN